MNSKKILTIGGNGLVGSRIVELLSLKYDFSDLSRSSGLDITDENSVLGKIKSFEADTVILFAAKADVDGCEKDKEKDLQMIKSKNTPQDYKEWLRMNTAWGLNAIGPHSVADACLFGNKKLIYISTDFVFGGKDMHRVGYSEEDNPSPVDWYGETKLKGEEVISSIGGLDYLIVRIAYPYRKDFVKKDFVRSIKEKLSQNLPVAAVTDHLMTPTFIDDIAKALDVLIQNNANGIFHVVGSDFISPYDAAIKIAETFNLDMSLISKTTREEYFKNRAPRPFQLGLNNDKIEKLGVKMSTFEEGIKNLL